MEYNENIFCNILEVIHMYNTVNKLYEGASLKHFCWLYFPASLVFRLEGVEKFPKYYYALVHAGIRTEFVFINYTK